MLKGARTCMLLGDSLLASSLRLPLPNQDPYGFYADQSPSVPNIGSNFVRFCSNDRTCPTGNGTLRYYAATKEFSWQAFGDTEGPRVSAPTTGFYKMESGSPNAAFYVALVDQSRPVADKADTINVAASSASYAADLKGFFGAAMVELNYPFDVVYNYGISGIKASEIVNMRSQWEGRFTDVTVIQAGTNESSTMALATAALDALRTLITSRIAIGSKVLVVGLFPVDGNTATAAGSKAWLNTQIAALCTELKVAFVNAFPYVADPTSTAGAWAAGFSGDGLHPNVTGSMTIAKYAVSPALAKLCDWTDARRDDAGVPWSATDAPYGNTLTNGLMTGTAGAKGARVTGTVPTSWNVSPTTGSNIACVCKAPQDASPVARTDGKPGNWFELAIDNSTGVLNETITASHSLYIAADRYALGDYVVAECDLEVVNAVGVKTFSIAGGILPGMTLSAITSLPSDLSGSYLGGKLKTTARSRPARIVLPPTNGNMTLTVVMQAGGTVTVRIARFSLHKVPPPVLS